MEKSSYRKMRGNGTDTLATCDWHVIFSKDLIS